MYVSVILVKVSAHITCVYATSFTCMRNTCEGEFLGVLIS